MCWGTAGGKLVGYKYPNLGTRKGRQGDPWSVPCKYELKPQGISTDITTIPDRRALSRSYITSMQSTTWVQSRRRNYAPGRSPTAMVNMNFPTESPPDSNNKHHTRTRPKGAAADVHLPSLLSPVPSRTTPEYHQVCRRVPFPYSSENPGATNRSSGEHV